MMMMMIKMDNEHSKERQKNSNWNDLADDAVDDWKLNKSKKGREKNYDWMLCHENLVNDEQIMDYNKYQFHQ